MKFTILFFCLAGHAFASTPKALPQVMVQKAAMTKVKQTLLFPALVKSRVESNIRADDDLIVIRSHVSLGQKVKKGDVLLELGNQDTSLNFHNRHLRAPVAGIVASLLVGNGEYVQKGQPLALINDPTNLYLKLEMPIAHYHEIKAGIIAKGTAHYQDKTPFSAKVTGVGAVLDASTGTMPVELEFTESQINLLPGTITNVELYLSEEEKLIMPEKALYYSGEKTFLPILQAGKVKKIEVKTRPATSGSVEISEGLKTGSEVIVGAGVFLKDGDSVEVMKN